MNRCSFERILSKKKIDNPIWFAMDSLEVASREEIEAIEIFFKVKLPIEYTAFLLSYGGGYFAFTKVYSANANSELSIVDHNTKAKFGVSFIAISDNGAGDYYGFEVSDAKCESEVSVYDQDKNMIVRDKYQDFYEYLCNIGLRM